MVTEIYPQGEGLRLRHMYTDWIHARYLLAAAAPPRTTVA